MTRSAIPLLALLLTLAPARAAAPPGGAPLPKGAGYAYAGRDWVVRYHSKVVPGTENFRAPTYTMRYFLCRPGSPGGRPILEEKTSSGPDAAPHQFAVTADGWVLYCGHDAPLWIGPQDRLVTFDFKKTFPPERLTFPNKREAYILWPTTAGLVAYPTHRFPEETVPVHFIPFRGRKLLMDRRVKLADWKANATYPGPESFQAAGDWVFWGTTVYNIRTQKRWEVSLPDGYDRMLWGSDGETALYRQRKTEKDGDVWSMHAFDLKTRKALASYTIGSDLLLAAVRDGVGYFYTMLREKKDGKPTVEVQALSLLQSGKPLLTKVVVADVHWKRFPFIATPRGLRPPSNPEALVEWANPVGQ